MASTVIPHFTRGGELLATVEKTLSPSSTQTVYTATEPCRIVIPALTVYTHIAINRTASSNNYDFYNFNNSGIGFKESSQDATMCGRDVVINGNTYLVFNLEKGDYISANYSYSSGVGITLKFYVYSR